MILEVASLTVRSGQATEFETAFQEAQQIIASMPGYLSHELRRCVERPNDFVLLVRWESIEAHEIGFRQSPEFQKWRQLLHHFYDPLPVISHYATVKGASGNRPI
jgi:heme-degrading monooxygenase HmoA